MQFKVSAAVSNTNGLVVFFQYKFGILIGVGHIWKIKKTNAEMEKMQRATFESLIAFGQNRRRNVKGNERRNK